jgi:ATP-dependent DNA ligase
MRFPEWVVPMATTLTQERFTGPEWTFERKYDGIRLLAFREGTSVRLYSRNQLLQYYPAIADVIGRLLWSRR